ncbi:hypothetical protein [Pinirhizobacter soli]|uniref:hypothetical protein n=1 Tax=Pinirhizobacter soli TaxID=2786953 RepID=UPI00202AA0B0|nr:hypothetical protein [Pinirhizobacter soli]
MPKAQTLMPLRSGASTVGGAAWVAKAAQSDKKPRTNIQRMRCRDDDGDSPGRFANAARVMVSPLTCVGQRSVDIDEIEPLPQAASIIGVGTRQRGARIDDHMSWLRLMYSFRRAYCQAPPVARLLKRAAGDFRSHRCFRFNVNNGRRHAVELARLGEVKQRKG